MELRTPNTPDLVVDGSADELVGETARRLSVGQLFEHPRRYCLFNRRDEGSLVEPGGVGEEAELESWPSHGRQLEHHGRLA